MKFLVTGGTGFIGNHLIKELLNRNHNVVVIGRDLIKAQKFDWFNRVDFVERDINESINRQDEFLDGVDRVIHLAWSGLPHYKELSHFEENLAPQYNFLKQLVLAGVDDITISGTCLEYGMQEGCLNTQMPSNPQIAYAVAKDTLRKFLILLQLKYNFRLKWLRLFYTYGIGQSKNSILSQLEQALMEGKKEFNMSGGEQVRDYLPVEEVARIIGLASTNMKLNGIYNCCSGNPISIKQFVLNYLEITGQKIKLNLGYYPYTDYEPMAFWGEAPSFYKKE